MKLRPLVPHAVEPRSIDVLHKPPTGGLAFHVDVARVVSRLAVSVDVGHALEVGAVAARGPAGLAGRVSRGGCDGDPPLDFVASDRATDHERVAGALCLIMLDQGTCISSNLQRENIVFCKLQCNSLPGQKSIMTLQPPFLLIFASCTFG